MMLELQSQRANNSWCECICIVRLAKRVFLGKSDEGLKDQYEMLLLVHPALLFLVPSGDGQRHQNRG